MSTSLSASLIVFCYVCLIKCIMCPSVPVQDYVIHNDTTEKELFVRVTMPEVLKWTPGLVVGRRMVNGQEIVFRVKNGEPATDGEIPYQVAFKMWSREAEIFFTFCGGTIISPKEIMSAAHCFRSKKQWDRWCRHSGRAKKSFLNGKYAVAGSLINLMTYQKKDSEKKGQWRTIHSVHFPNNYVFPRHDVAVVFLREPYQWTDKIKPITYASVYKDYAGTCLVSGFGDMEGDKTSRQLMKADLRMLSASQCTKLHNRNMALNLCTSDGVKNVGIGDSGGPLVCKNTGDPHENSSLGILAGIASGVTTDETSAIYVRVTAYRNFIDTARRLDAPRHHASKSLLLASTVLVQILH